MTGRRTIGHNPLAIPPPGGTASEAAARESNPLDVLIPKIPAASARQSNDPGPDQGGDDHDQHTAETPVDASGETVATAMAQSPAQTRLATASEPASGTPTDAALGSGMAASAIDDDSLAPDSAQSGPGSGPTPGQHLVFQMGGEELAISIVCVREIVDYGVVTRVPRMPACVRGVTNLRGTIVPIVDLAVRLGLPSAPITSHTCVVVVDANFGGQSSVVGLVADVVTAVRDLTREEVSPTPALGSRVQVEAFSGLGRTGDHLFPVVDTERILADLELGQRPATYR